AFQRGAREWSRGRQSTLGPPCGESRVAIGRGTDGLGLGAIELLEGGPQFRSFGLEYGQLAFEPGIINAGTVAGFEVEQSFLRRCVAFALRSLAFEACDLGRVKGNPLLGGRDVRGLEPTSTRTL